MRTSAESLDLASVALGAEVRVRFREHGRTVVIVGTVEGATADTLTIMPWGCAAAIELHRSTLRRVRPVAGAGITQAREAIAAAQAKAARRKSGDGARKVGPKADRRIR